MQQASTVVEMDSEANPVSDSARVPARVCLEPKPTPGAPCPAWRRLLPPRGYRKTLGAMAHSEPQSCSFRED